MKTRAIGVSMLSQMPVRTAAHSLSYGMKAAVFSRAGTMPCWQLSSRSEGGMVVAVKGLGGFHLIVDARNEQAVAELAKAQTSQPTNRWL